MPYEKQAWENGITILTAEHMEHIEDGIIDLNERLDEFETPNDEHINALIDAKLGVIENGTY